MSIPFKRNSFIWFSLVCTWICNNPRFIVKMNLSNLTGKKNSKRSIKLVLRVYFRVLIMGNVLCLMIIQNVKIVYVGVETQSGPPYKFQIIYAGYYGCRILRHCWLVLLNSSYRKTLGITRWMYTKSKLVLGLFVLCMSLNISTPVSEFTVFTLVSRDAVHVKPKEMSFFYL